MRKYTIQFYYSNVVIEAEVLGDAFMKAREQVLTDPNITGFRIAASSDENGENTIRSDVSYQREMEPAPEVNPDHECVEDCHFGD